MSKSKSKTTSNQTTNQTATTTPNTPDWLAQPWQQYTGQVSNLMNSGQPLVAGASPLQQQAFNNASNLSGGGWFDQAAGMAMQAGNAGPNYSGQAAQAGVTGYNGQGYQAAGPAGGNTYQAASTQGQGYQAQTYDPATGQAQGYNPNTIDWSQFGVDQTSVGPMAQASNRDMSREDIDRLMNTGLNDVIDASRADYEASAGRSRAQQATAAAMNGGARNSNNAIQAALMEGELSRAQNTGLSGLRYDAYNTAAGLAQADLARAAQTSQFNAGQTNQGSLAQAQIDANRNSLVAQLGQTGLLANQNALNQAGQFNAGQQNQFGLANMDSQNQAGQFNAGSQNAAAQFGADAQNTANLANQQAQNQAGQFNAGSLNQSQLDAAGRQDTASQFGANAQNAANQFTAGQMNNASQFNAAAQNQNNQFNAGQADSALNRQLSAAGLLGQLSTGQGANERDNIALQAALGGSQRDIANQTSQVSQLAAIQALLSGIPLDAFIGQTMTNSGQMSGTNVNKQSGFGIGWSAKNGLSIGG